jgi:hypothetical protein
VSETRDEKVDALLHDAEHAHGGAQFADMVRDTANAKALRAKRDRLYAKALKLDPKQEAPCWDESGYYGTLRNGFR